MKNPPLKKWQYYGPFEVVIHNSPRDCWVSLLGKVFNITPLVSIYIRDPCIKPLLAMAGKDISHWFDEKTGDIQHYVHPVTGNYVPYLPHGKIPDIEPQVPDTRWRPNNSPWWKSELYQIGLLTKRTRPLRIINMLTCKEVQINVCCEDTFQRIAERYSIFNKDTDSYIWRYDGKAVNMYKTLEDNGILDERDHFCELGIPANFYVPAILLYFTDDFNHLEDDLDDEDECEIVKQQKSITVDLFPLEINAKDYLSMINMSGAEENVDNDNLSVYYREALLELPPISADIFQELMSKKVNIEEKESKIQETPTPIEEVPTTIEEQTKTDQVSETKEDETVEKAETEHTEYSDMVTEEQSDFEAEHTETNISEVENATEQIEATEAEETDAETNDKTEVLHEVEAVTEAGVVPEVLPNNNAEKSEEHLLEETNTEPEQE